MWKIASGHIKFLIFYLLCGVAATFAQLAFSVGSNVPNLGASGAIAGVLGAYLLLFPSERVNVLMGYAVIPLPAVVVIGLWFVLQLCSGFGSFESAAQTGGVAYMAHIGGFLAGLVMAFFLRGNLDRYDSGLIQKAMNLYVDEKVKACYDLQLP